MFVCCVVIVDCSLLVSVQFLIQDDMKHFHGTYKKVCDKHDPEYYAKFKKVSQSLEMSAV